MQINYKMNSKIIKDKNLKLLKRVNLQNVEHIQLLRFMLNKELTQKKYFQLITTGHYIDVQNSDSQWVMAKILQKDKKYVWVAYDGYMNKQDQFFINSYRVAPLRAFTEGFTGTYAKVFRNNMPKIQDLKNYIQIAQQKFFNQKAKAFEITQLLRGQLFVYMHDLFIRQCSLNETDIQETNNFLDLWMNFLVLLIDKVKQYQEQYFAAPLSVNKLLYLNNPKIAVVQSLQQILILLQMIVKADGYKFVNLWKYNKNITSQQKLSEDFLKRKGLVKLYDIFMTNDKKGQWYPSSVRKSIYKIMLRYAVSKMNFSLPQMPKYLVRDFQQFYSIYPFMWKCSPEIQLENQYVDFSINILLTNSPFDAKLKSISQLKKVLEGKNYFQFLDQKKVLTKMDQMGVLQQLLDNKNFNPEVFKRFVPILNVLCKIRSLSLKNIQSLFQIVKFRHQSETSIIFDIISEISEFAPSSLLDNVYNEICKIDINSEQTIRFIRTFTIKAVQNLSKQKSILSGFFGRKKGGSSKYGYYGLNLLYKESHDDGRIIRQKIQFVLSIIKQFLSQNLLKQQRWNYLNYCVDFIKSRKNFGQSIKLIGLILTTFDQTNFFAEDRKKVIEKLEAKYNLIDIIIQGFKNIESIPQTKITHEECFQYFYDLIESFSFFVKVPLKVNQIQFLWYKCDSNLLLNFLRKPKPNQKFKKLIPIEVIEEIFTIIFKKPSFYKRTLTIREFDTIYELFLSYHMQKDNLSMNVKDGLVRYNKHNLLGLQYFINFLQYSKEQQNFEKAVRKTVDLILRPNQKKLSSIDSTLEQKVLVWKELFKKCIQRLLSNPKKCLTFIQLFYSSIEGKLFKQINTNDTSNVQILVEIDDQLKSVSIQRFSTIFRLRKIIKQKFKLYCDFDMFNVKINKIITYEEQQDFSVNAMPLVDNGRAVSIKIQLKNNKYHQQQVACLLFKQQIEKQEKLYSMLFKIIEEKELTSQIQRLFWKSIQLLSLNKVMMTDVQKCDNFTLQKWMKYFQTSSDSSLQYKLSIVLSLIKSSDKWAFKMEQHHGLLALILTFLKILQKWQYMFENETLSLKMMDVIEKVYEKCSKKQLQNDILKQMNVTLIKTLDIEFNSKSNETKSQQQIPQLQNHISINLINKVLSVYLSNLKMLMNANEKQIHHIELSTFLKILNFGLFIKKTEATQKFAQEVSISVNFAIYDNIDNKKIILHFLIEHLSFNQILKRQRTQNFFKFLITILYSFEQTNKKNQDNQVQIEGLKINSQLKAIWIFVNAIIENDKLKDDQKSHEQILFGSLSLLKFVLVKASQGFQVDYQQIFKKLIQYFVFPLKQSFSKRLKTQKNKKILFQILKKISFHNPQTLNVVIGKLVPFLQQNKYRKNSILNWNLHFENSQKRYFVGLQNLGATCYINCLFQQLFMIEKFRENFISIESRQYKPELEKNQIYQLQKIFYSLKHSDKKAQTTKNFCSSFITFQGQPISPVVQSDADQFFNTLMDRIQTFLKHTSHHDILEKTFQGQLSNQLNCEGCPHRSEKIEPFMSIGVNLKNKKTLEQALKGYVEGQILDGDNAYYCEPCDKKVRTLKRLCIKQLPNILVIVLKRFEYDFDTYKKIKINSYLQFPQKLNMYEYTSEYLQSKSMEKMPKLSSDQEIKHQNINDTKNIFHLRGTVIHAGYADAGHYYSFIKDKDKWYEFNDEYIKQINYSKIQEQGFGGDDKDSDDLKVQKYKNAYILFYQKQTLTSDNLLQDTSKQNINQIQQQKVGQQKLIKQMKDNIQNQNYETNIFSSLIESNFIHFWQNLSILQNQFIHKFIFLYFHTVVLRDKLKYEYARNYFRILIKYLSNQKSSEGIAKKNQLTEWFLQQINKAYIKQFLIEAPKSTRFVCVSLVLTAIHHAQNIPEQLPLLLISSLRKTGMSPLGDIFTALLKRKQIQIKLKQLNYFDIITSFLFNEKKLQSLPQSQMQIESYFGSDCSEVEAQKQKCSSSLLNSLQTFEDMSIETILKVNELYSFRTTNKIYMKKLALIILKDIQDQTKKQNDIIELIRMCEQKINGTNCGKEFVQKYLFFIRYLICFCQASKLKNKILEFVTISLQNFILSFSRQYEPMDWVIREITRIACKNIEFRNNWKSRVCSNSNLKLQIDTWLRQIQKPQYINLKDPFFQNIRSMDVSQKTHYLKKYSKKMRMRSAWMMDPMNQQINQGEESDLQKVKQNEIIHIRNKVFVIKQKFEQSILYLASYPDKDDHTVWIYLEKNEVQIFNNL